MNNWHSVKAIKAMLNRKGFTLVEVLIALLVLGIIFVPVSNAFLQSVHVNQHLQREVKAAREAQAAMEITLSLMNELNIPATTIPETESENNNDEMIRSDVSVDSSVRVGSDTTGHVELDKQLEEQMVTLLTEFNTANLIESDTRVDILPLHKDSPFFVITATSTYDIPDSVNNFTLTTLRLPGAAPWLKPKEHRVVTP